LTILLVEDELPNLKAMLKKLNYHVLATASPREALALAKVHAGPIDLLITDVIMPEMNGKDLALELTRMHPHIRSMYMSGYTADIIAHHDVLENGVNFLQKPFSLSASKGVWGRSDN
jgi:two-component system, cell cycle sensor histidine kinase and response regulator CckA